MPPRLLLPVPSPPAPLLVAPLIPVLKTRPPGMPLLLLWTRRRGWCCRRVVLYGESSSLPPPPACSSLSRLQFLERLCHADCRLPWQIVCRCRPRERGVTGPRVPGSLEHGSGAVVKTWPLTPPLQVLWAPLSLQLPPCAYQKRAPRMALLSSLLQQQIPKKMLPSQAVLLWETASDHQARCYCRCSGSMRVESCRGRASLVLPLQHKMALFLSHPRQSAFFGFRWEVHMMVLRPICGCCHGWCREKIRSLEEDHGQRNVRAFVRDDLSRCWT